MTATQQLIIPPYCLAGIHLRDTVDGVCLECGDHKPAAKEGAELRANEPPVASAVIASGPTGTVWQRLGSDGWWHSTTGKRASWSHLTKADRPGSRTRIVYLPPWAGEAV